MSSAVHALVAHARMVPANQRSALAAALRAKITDGAVLLETCHRVEVYAAGSADLPPARLPSGVQQLEGEAAARHLVALAVGRESAVVAEDQILHQLRMAVQGARAAGPLPSNLDRLLDVALRAGRRARSWLPASRRSLADVALDRVIGRTAQPAGRVLVVGAGEMGLRAAHAIAARGAAVSVGSRTPERAAVLAQAVKARVVPFDPGPDEIGEVAGVVLALAGPWQMTPATVAALLESAAWVVDLSAPPAIPQALATRLGRRLLAIDDLADDAGPPPSQALLDRLDALIDQAVADYVSWSAVRAERSAARALADKAAEAQTAELTALWQRMPTLDPAQREAVERMARHLTERLLRDPLEQLHQDGDGRQASAVRELFRL